LDKILFLDRDGVINKDPNGYTYDYNTLEYNKDLIEYISRNFNDYIKIIVTNQSGIARGKYTKNDFLELSAYIINDLKKFEIIIDEIYYAPYLPDSNHFDRKPNPGMIIKGLMKYKINPKNCIMIGDKETDREAAKHAGIDNFIMYKEGLYYDKDNW